MVRNIEVKKTPQRVFDYYKLYVINVLLIEEPKWNFPLRKKSQTSLVKIRHLHKNSNLGIRVRH